MITAEKIRIYNKYQGNYETWERSHPHRENTIELADWGILDGLLQDLFLVKKGMVSRDFEKDTMDRINENCDSPAAIELLNNIVEMKLK